MNHIQTESSHYTLAAEQAVIGGLLLDGNKWDEVSPIINASNFYLAAHKVIYSAIESLSTMNTPIDIITVEKFIKSKAQSLLEEVGGLAYLAELSKNTPSVSNIATYAQIVRRDSQVRQLYALGNTLRAEANQIHTQESLDGLIEKTEKQLTELTLNQQDETNVSILNAIDTVLRKMEFSEQHNSLVTGVPYGITQLDTNTSGSQSGDLIILAARPSMGKTALSLCFAASALDAFPKKPVQYYSLEMPAEQIMQRFLAMRSRVSLSKIRQATLMEDEDWAKFAETIAQIKEDWEDCLLIDDSSYLTPQMLRTRVRRNIRKYGKPTVVIVDYLQLMTAPEFKNGQNRHLEISEISRALKNLAKEIECPVIALSQLNRNLEQRADKRPMNSDLRESGSLEQDADVILFIYRDEVYNEDSELRGIAEIIIGKQRNGPIGTVFSRFKGELSLFESISDTEYEQIKSR